MSSRNRVRIRQTLPQALEMRLRVSDEDPLDKLLSGGRVVAHYRNGSTSVEIVITQTAHVCDGLRSMVAQQGNNLAG